MVMERYVNCRPDQTAFLRLCKFEDWRHCQMLPPNSSTNSFSAKTFQGLIVY